MERASRYLEQQPDEVTASSIYDAVKGKRPHLVAAVSFLVSDGYASEREGNRRSRLIRSTKPYRDPFPSGSPPFPDAGSPLVPAVPPSIEGNGNGSHEEDDEGRWQSLLQLEPEDADFEPVDVDEATL